MVYAKFEDQRSSDSADDFFKGFGDIWAWPPSCDVILLM